MSKKVISQSRLKELFDYHQDGYFIEKTNRGRNCATKLGTILTVKNHTSGRFKITIDGGYYFYHRMVFLWHYGFLPKILDHKNRNPVDNRIENLRAASNSQNVTNRSLPAKNKSGYRGVSLKLGNRNKIWLATADNTFIGYFKNKKDAARAYDKMAKQIFGEFAVLNFPSE